MIFVVTVILQATTDAAVLHRNFRCLLLRRLTRNLIENAQRYGAPGIAPEVSLKCQGDTIELAVCDAGPGVPEAERNQLLYGNAMRIYGLAA